MVDSVFMSFSFGSCFCFLLFIILVPSEQVVNIYFQLFLGNKKPSVGTAEGTTLFLFSRLKPLTTRFNNQKQKTTTLHDIVGLFTSELMD